MEQQKIYNEFMTAFNLSDKYLAAVDTEFGEYNQYYSNQHNWCRGIENRIRDIIVFNGSTQSDLINHISKLEMTPEQKQQLSEVRKMPMYEKIMGEQALTQKQTLESLLGTSINNESGTFFTEKGTGAKVACKDEETLWAELEENDDKLTALLSNGQITKEQYQSLSMALDNIYTHYISQTKGEQIPFRKISEAEYSRIKEQALENGISVSDQMMEINQDLLYEHEQMQELANSTHKMR